VNPILSKANKYIRERSGNKQIAPCVLWQRGEFLHIALNSIGCAYRKTGSCVMCDYGFGNALTVEEVTASLKQSMSVANKPVNELLIGSCGSVLDEYEISCEARTAILEYVATLNVQTLILETHYSTINELILDEIKQKLTDSKTEIVIEIGLESANSFVLENSLNKDICLQKLENAVDLIKKKGMGVVLNVLLGVPFLSPYQQLQDALQTIEYAFTVGANRVDVFPINIKPHTLLAFLNEKKMYEPPSYWMIAELLRTLPSVYLNRIEFSWFGDRQKNGTALDAIPPCSCENCDRVLFDFVTIFMSSFDAQFREKHVSKFFEQDFSLLCDCYSKWVDRLTDTLPINPNSVKKQHQILEGELFK
jgi:radical SAM enzyme (TIGR01210 family)